MRHILCFGNPLHGDDGFGQAVFSRLAELSLADDVRLIDAGTASLNALYWFQNCCEVTIIDSLAPGEQPGSLCQLTIEDVLPESATVGHAGGVGDLLRALQALREPLPAIRIWAAEAELVQPFKIGLTAPVLGAVERLVAQLSTEFSV